MSDTERAALDIAREISLEEQRDDLRAQLEAVTRERDDWAKDFGEKADRLLEVMRERDEARALWDDALRQVLHHSSARGRAEADAARLREALMQVRDAMLATGQGPDGDDDPRRPVATVVWRALASTPSAEPTPRDMRVAEAVANALMDAAWRGVVDLRAIVAKVTP